MRALYVILPILCILAIAYRYYSAGSLTYTGVLADARTYLMPIRPATLAFRGG